MGSSKEESLSFQVPYRDWDWWLVHGWEFKRTLRWIQRLISRILGKPLIAWTSLAKRIWPRRIKKRFKSIGIGKRITDYKN